MVNVSVSRGPPATSGKVRVLSILREFPQKLLTDIKNKLKAMGDEREGAIVALKPANRPYKNHLSFTPLESADQAVECGQDFKPNVIHVHFFYGLEFVMEIAERLGLPYAIRSHSFDVLTLRPRILKRRIKKLVNRPGALALGPVAMSSAVAA